MYSTYFRNEQQIKGVVSRADGSMSGFSGLISSVKKNLVIIDLLGTGLDGLRIKADSDVSVTTTNGWTAYRCKAVVVQDLKERELHLKLVGSVTEKQKRENFRLDTLLPFSFSIPESQKIDNIELIWRAGRKSAQTLPPPIIVPDPEGPRLVKWNNEADIPASDINLSVNGLRFKTATLIPSRTFLLINLFLPFEVPQVVILVTEVLRSHSIETAVSRRENFSTAMRIKLIHDDDQKLLVNFIFEEQRRLLRIRSGLDS